MKLEEIGFYTLYDNRAKNVSWNSQLKRCELILTDKCNFNCLYCRGIKKEFRGDLLFEDIKNIIDIWSSGNLETIRFSGGEPTLNINLLKAVKYAEFKNIKNIGISTNGSASIDFYIKLFQAGINDFSISFDACCSTTADQMAGCNSRYNHVKNVIKELSKMTYVTVGVVFDGKNKNELKKIIEICTKLNVSDIRIISTAQSNEICEININTNYKILNYRLNNLRNGRKFRGIHKTDCNKCHLVKDDMVVLNNYHFPCIIYLREQGNPIGKINSLKNIRIERKKWFEKHDSYEDDICRNNCLNLCIDYNNRVEMFKRKRNEI